jgi:hypothetical protein
MALKRQRLSQRRKAARYAGTGGTGNPDTDVTLPMRPAEVQSEMWLSRTDFTNLLRSAVLAAGPEDASGDASGDADAGREEAAPDAAQPAGVSPAGPDAPSPPSTEPTAELGPLPRGPSPTGSSPSVGLSGEVHPAPTGPVNLSVDITLAELPPPTPSQMPAPSVLAASSGVAAEAQAPSQDPDSSGPPLPPEIPDLSSVTTIPLNVALADLPRRQLRAQHLERFAAAGVLAALLLGAAASAPLIMSQHRPEPPAAAEGVAGNPAPAGPPITIPKPDPGSSHGGVQAHKDLPDATEAAPAAASAGANTSAGKLTPSRGTDLPASRTMRPVTGGAGRSAPPAEKPVPAPQRSDRIPPEVYPWYEMAADSASNSSRAHFRPGPPAYPYDAPPQ